MITKAHYFWPSLKLEDQRETRERKQRAADRWADHKCKDLRGRLAVLAEDLGVAFMIISALRLVLWVNMDLSKIRRHGLRL